MQLKKLQYVQNTAARIVTQTRKFDHITPILIDLHWLPVSYRIVFNILLLVFKSLNNLSLSYLADRVSYKSHYKKLAVRIHAAVRTTSIIHENVRGIRVFQCVPLN